MVKVLNIVLVLEKDANLHAMYTAPLEGSGFLVEFSSSIEHFYEKIKELIPTVIIINTGKKGFELEPIYKKLRSSQFFNKIPIIMGVDKVVYSVEQKAKKFGLDYIEYPLKNTTLLQLVKKHSKKIEIPKVVYLEDKPTLSFSVEAKFVRIAVDHFSFVSPVKYNTDSVIKIESHLLNEFGVVHKNFKVLKDGYMTENKLFENEVCFRGLSVDVLKKLKKYYNNNRSKS